MKQGDNLIKTKDDDDDDADVGECENGRESCKYNDTIETRRKFLSLVLSLLFAYLLSIGVIIV